MTEMAERKTRVDFNAPKSLVERADAVAELLDISRTQLLIEALRGELDARLSDERFQQTLKQAYYDNRIEFETVEAMLGTEKALRLKLLRESLDRDAPEPQLEGELPTQKEFYDGDLPEWTPDEDDEASERSSPM